MPFSHSFIGAGSVLMYAGEVRMQSLIGQYPGSEKKVTRARSFINKGINDENKPLHFNSEHFLCLFVIFKDLDISKLSSAWNIKMAANINMCLPGVVGYHATDLLSAVT